jgi:4-amino-4-deoxy-L-arabinose transferase-like glycosyltransferase
MTAERLSPRARTLLAIGIFLAFLAGELIWLVRTLPQAAVGDEWRYVYYAENLLRGYFSPRERVFLWNGPGYPLFLVPFVKVDWVDGARYANAFLHAAAMAYVWVTLSRRLRLRWALVAVAVLGLYPPLYEHLPTTQTEVFCFFLTAAWVEHSLRAPSSRTHAVIAGVLLACLCLTKVVFGMVLLVFLLVLLLLWLHRRHDPLRRAFLGQAALALLLCLPYLAYTYSLTGRLLYWSSAGPNTFYWLTSPHADEWGDWYHHGWVDRVPSLRAHHKAIMDETGGLTRNPRLSGMEQLFNNSSPEAADIFLRQGLRNVREHPLKFARNWCGNVARMFLDVPTSFRGTPLWNSYSLSHLPLLVWTALVCLFGWRRRVPPPVEWWPLALFLLLSLAAYSLSSAVARYMISLLPLWWLGTWCWVGRHPAAGPPGGRPSASAAVRVSSMDDKRSAASHK